MLIVAVLFCSNSLMIIMMMMDVMSRGSADMQHFDCSYPKKRRRRHKKNTNTPGTPN